MYNYLMQLAEKYNMPFERVISIALNRYGILIPNIPDNRLRFNLKLLDSNETNYYAVCINTYLKSPFTIKKGNLMLENIPVGIISNIEKDTCLSTYFRNNKKAITFNSNSRSKCIGCKFCGTYSLSDDDVIIFDSKEKVQKYFNNLLHKNQIATMGDIEDITICSGCFENENKLIEHLLMVSESFKEMGFNGRLNYIGSQLRNYNKISMLKNNIGNFGIYFSIEKFIDREKFMKPEKSSLTMEKAKELMNYCTKLDITTTFLYILGLEKIETIEYYFSYLKDSINKFPIVQVFQDYTINQEQYRIPEAKDIEYYLKARETINNILKDKEYSPNSWECFRSLYFKDKKTKELIKK